MRRNGVHRVRGRIQPIVTLLDWCVPSPASLCTGVWFPQSVRAENFGYFGWDNDLWDANLGSLMRTRV